MAADGVVVGVAVVGVVGRRECVMVWVSDGRVVCETLVRGAGQWA